MRSLDSALRTDDAALADRIRAGDSRAFETLFHAHYESLCRFAESYVRSHADAEDLVQGMFVQLWDQRQRWVLRGSLRAYLYTAVRNASLNVLKHRLVERRTLDDPLSIPRVGTGAHMPAPDEEAVGHELEMAVDRAVTELPERYRQVITLRAQHGLTIPEIARILDLPVKTAETRAARAVAALRAVLERFLT